MDQNALSFRELLAYTDFLANRWLSYFAQNPEALDLDVGGNTGSVRLLVQHVFLVERFFADRLEEKEPNRDKAEDPTLEEVSALHKAAHARLVAYVETATDDQLTQKQKFGPGREVSNRKILAQAVLHGVHHWAQIAMEVRQGGFPPLKPQDIIITDVME